MNLYQIAQSIKTAIQNNYGIEELHCIARKDEKGQIVFQDRYVGIGDMLISSGYMRFRGDDDYTIDEAERQLSSVKQWEARSEMRLVLMHRGNQTPEGFTLSLVKLLTGLLNTPSASIVPVSVSTDRNSILEEETDGDAAKINMTMNLILFDFEIRWTFKGEACDIISLCGDISEPVVVDCLPVSIFDFDGNLLATAQSGTSYNVAAVSFVLNGSPAVLYAPGDEIIHNDPLCQGVTIYREQRTGAPVLVDTIAAGGTYLIVGSPILDINDVLLEELFFTEGVKIMHDAADITIDNITEPNIVRITVASDCPEIPIIPHYVKPAVQDQVSYWAGDFMDQWNSGIFDRVQADNTGNRMRLVDQYTLHASTPNHLSGFDRFLKDNGTPAWNGSAFEYTNGEGTDYIIIDVYSGLMIYSADLGLLSDYAAQGFANAHEYACHKCDVLNVGGVTNWRVPCIEESLRLYCDFTQTYYHASNPFDRTTTSSNFWTSLVKEGGTSAWLIISAGDIRRFAATYISLTVVYAVKNWDAP